MRRIAIIGCAGAGKSTLARELARLLDLPLIHLDALHWKPGWVPTPKDQWRQIQEELVARPAWIIDGNYDATLDIRLAAADTVVFMDLPRLRCVWRVLVRAVHPDGRSRPDIGPGCRERPWSMDFLRFLWWIWCYGRDNRPRVLAKLQVHAQGRQIIRLKTSRQAAEFLRQVSACPADTPAS